MKKPWSFYYFASKPVVLPDRYTAWRLRAQEAKLSAAAQQRVEWFVFYFRVAGEQVTATCQHFRISRKTFYKWLQRFVESQWDVYALEDRSCRPYHCRTWAVTAQEETRICQLRRQHLYYGKQKLQVLYQQQYGESISTWKIERVIRKYQLYPDKVRAAKLAKKRARGRKHPKKRVTQLVKEDQLWFLLQLDTKVIYDERQKRYRFVAVDHASKFGYARMYPTKSSRAAADFLYRLYYLIHQPIANLLMDNGSEFKDAFQRAAVSLGIEQYFSRIKTPKDNAEAERFIQTLLYEWFYVTAVSSDVDTLNTQLTEWLIEYNFHRPHQALNYLTPMQYITNEREKMKTIVLPMYSATTISSWLQEREEESEGSMRL
ncbi:MAG: integrase core domain-containing protein, partial [bacterium]|nr:integrase core domain-containing protein [bacterium]